MKHQQAIPAKALDDRLAFVGTSGSGKTYGAGTAVEALLEAGARVLIFDPLDVWYGLRLLPDGKRPSPYAPVIFGGAHADLPITERAGAVIGEAIAHMSESAIVSLDTLPSEAAKRRFMLAALSALYREASGEPVHLVFDEADAWAPQRILDREGDAQKLLGQMQNIVRRGRIKGFCPWLITQRPAVLSKDVLSQADGLVSFKLTSSQDRDALGAWIEGQADREQGKEILAGMPKLARGEAWVWIPGHEILEKKAFPEKRTFDSSRTPKRGAKNAKVTLEALELDVLRGRLADVEAEAKANDPKVARGELAAAKRELEQLKRDSNAALATARVEGFSWAMARMRESLEEVAQSFALRAEMLKGLLEPATISEAKIGRTVTMRRDQIHVPSRGPDEGLQSGDIVLAAAPQNGTAGSAPEQRVLGALHFWAELGFYQPSRAQVALLAGYSLSSSGFRNLLGGLRTRGLIDYPTTGHVGLTEEGKGSPCGWPTDAARALEGVLSPAQRRIIAALADGATRSRDELAAATEYSPASSGFRNLLGSLRTLELLDYPSAGMVQIEDWVKNVGPIR